MSAPTTRPIPLQVRPDNLPVSLRPLRRFVCWSYTWKAANGAAGEWTKPPIIATEPTRHASSTNSETWRTFDEARRTVEDGNCDGLGVTVGDRLTAVDLDHCVNEHGIVAAWAEAIIARLDTYAERSPSGRGIRLLLWADGLPPAGRKNGDIEIYNSGRYVTLTGHRLPGPVDLQERTPEIAAVHAEVFTKNTGVAREPPASPIVVTPHDRNDAELIEIATRAKNGDKFCALWSGDASAYRSRSEADLALCDHLAFYTGAEAGRIDRLFRQSGLMRPKWETRRGTSTYGEVTIAKAIAGGRDTYNPRRVRPAPRLRSSQAEDSEPPMPSDDALPAGEQQAVPLGEFDPTTGRLVLSAKRTLPTAKAYVREFHAHPDGCTLHAHASRLLEWHDNRYVELEDESVKHRLQPWLHGAVRYIQNQRTRVLELVQFDSNPATVNQALDSVRSHVYLPGTTVAPSWLDGRRQPSATEILPFRSLNLHIPTGRILAATPALFTTNALAFDYDAAAPPPSRWLAFLRQLWPEDDESIALLQEWFAYCLTVDTSQQKILLLVGPRRSGKGTIGRVLTHLVGAANVVGPTTNSLAGNFGLQPLIDKSLAIVSDARFSGDQVPIVVERLLNISGEDTLTIDRKFLGAVTLKLPTRFMFLTNELPRLSDASTALAGRFLVLRLTQSFYGQEDPGLTSQLLADLPGILLWAIEGWHRLHARRRFLQPASAMAAIQQIEDLASPVSAFVRERCIIRSGHRVPIEQLYAAWKRWCEQEGRNAVTTVQMFGRDLGAAVPEVERRKTTGFVPFYEGIGLRDGDD